MFINFDKEQIYFTNNEKNKCSQPKFNKHMSKLSTLSEKIAALFPKVVKIF